MYKFTKGHKLSFWDLSENHYWNLNPFSEKDGTKIYKWYSLCYKIRVQSKSRKAGAILFKHLLQDDFKFLKRIITGLPSELSKVINIINRRIDEGIYPQIYDPINDKLTRFGKNIESIFNYNNFIDPDRKWSAYSLAEELSIDVCTYCNRNFTFTLTKGLDKIVRPEFDHFYAKSVFPYLAISFYNLIPSCHICNSNLKGLSEFSLQNNIHPYVTSLDDLVKFTVVFKKPDIDVRANYFNAIPVFYGDLDSFELKLVPKNGTSIRNYYKAKHNIETFYLVELYNRHKDMVVEMIMNSIIYSEEYINDLYKSFNGKLFRNREDVLRFITHNYIDNESKPKRVFSKLTMDIYKEFGLRY